MSCVTVEVEIDHGRLVAKEPEKLPDNGAGLLTILQTTATGKSGPRRPGRRVDLPLIRGDGSRIINPSPAELDASLWD